MIPVTGISVRFPIILCIVQMQWIRFTNVMVMLTFFALMLTFHQIREKEVSGAVRQSAHSILTAIATE